MNGLERFGAWITKNPVIIVAVAVLLTLLSVHYAQQIESQGMNTESFVSKDSSLYQLYDHINQENFGIDANVILIENDDVTKEEVLKAALRFSDQIKKVPNVLGIQSLADLVADTEYQNSCVRQIPSQERIDAILEDANSDQLKSLMADDRHARMIVGMPSTLKESQRKELLLEINNVVTFAQFPAIYSVTVTGDPAFQDAIVDTMNGSNGSILALCGALMIVALLVFRHVRWPLLPIPVVFLGITWTFGAMGFLDIPMSMVTFAAFPILIGIGIDYAIQFHNRIDEELIKGKSPMEAAISTVNHVAFPAFIALIVTEAGFVALLSSTVPMINDFGKVCIIGLVMCYLSALFVGVTVLCLSERKAPRKKKIECQSYSSAIGTFIETIANFSVERWKSVLVVALILALTGNYADSLVPIETNIMNFIPQDLTPVTT